jgi:hypothetical protein
VTIPQSEQTSYDVWHKIAYWYSSWYNVLKKWPGFDSLPSKTKINQEEQVEQDSLLIHVLFFYNGILPNGFVS